MKNDRASGQSKRSAASTVGAAISFRIFEAPVSFDNLRSISTRLPRKNRAKFLKSNAEMISISTRFSRSLGDTVTSLPPDASGYSAERITRHAGASNSDRNLLKTIRVGTSYSTLQIGVARCAFHSSNSQRGVS